jgi:hypothetical protein
MSYLQVSLDFKNKIEIRKTKMWVLSKAASWGVQRSVSGALGLWHGVSASGGACGLGLHSHKSRVRDPAYGASGLFILRKHCCLVPK